MRLPLISAIFVSVALAGPMAAAKTVKHSEEAKNSAAASPESRESETRSVDAHGLTGLLHASPDRVRGRLGQPSIAKAEGKGAFWTYRAPRCALYIFFRDEGGLKVSGAAVGPRKRGVAAPDVDTCLAELEQSQDIR